MFTQHEPNTGQIIHLHPAADYLVIDIETGDAPESAVEAALAGWRPPPNIRDPGKIEARREEAADKIRERAALLDTSPILCIAAKSQHDAIMFNSMGCTVDVDYWIVKPADGEANMLRDLRTFLDQHTTPCTMIVGHNIRAFDLPKLRNAYLRHRLRLPEILSAVLLFNERSRTLDTARAFRNFSMEHYDDFCPSLETVATSLGIPRPKSVISGADVPRLHRAGEYAPILIYCAVDCATTERAMQLMCSTAADLQ